MGATVRDLQAHGQVPLNGIEPSVLDLHPEDDRGPSPEMLASLATQRRVVKRDQKLSEMAVLLIDTAKMIEPVVSLMGGQIMRWGIMGSVVYITAYALAHPSWERGAIAGGFMLLSLLLLRRA